MNKKDVERYFSMSQEDLEKENQRIMGAIDALREEQTFIARALDLAVQVSYARARVAEMSESERIALKKVLLEG